MWLPARSRRLYLKAHSAVPMVVRYIHPSKDQAVVLHLRNFFMCDFKSLFDDIPAIERTFSERNCNPPIDLFHLKELYTLLRRQTLYYVKLQDALSEFELEKNKKPQAPKAIDKMSGTELKQYYLIHEIDNFEKSFIRLRNAALYHCFSFPNQLHADTPQRENERVIWSNVSGKIDGKDHIEVGRRLGVLEYLNPTCYYLLNEAANLEIALQRYVSHVLSHELNFKPFLNPDTCHDLLLKGIYVENFEDKGLVLEDSPHRLVGGASFSAFCAYKAGTSVHSKFLPEKFFACGRRYISVIDDTDDRGLYAVRQRSDIHALVATSTEEEIHEEYKKMLDWLISLYERLGLSFRVCNKGASILHLGESLSTNLQLYSAHRREFIDAAYISYGGDFASQRLHIINHDKNENYFTTWLLDITVLSVPIVTANLLEKSENELFLPDCLVPYMHNSFTASSQV